MKNRNNTIKIISCLLFILTLISCASSKEEEKYYATKYNLTKIPIKMKRFGNKISSLDLIEFEFKVKEIQDSLEKGRVDLSDNLTYSHRTLLTIRDSNNVSLDAEAYMIYSKGGFDKLVTETSTYYGRTSQANFPFTFSIAADPTTKVFSGKAKRRDKILTIEGTPYVRDKLLPRRSEAGFFINLEDKILAFVSLVGYSPSVFIQADLESELRKTVLYTAGYLTLFQRYSTFNISNDLVRGHE